MNFTSLGDLSQGFALRTRNAALRSEMQTLQIEVTTGQAASTRKHVHGNYAHLSEIERSLTLLDGYRVATHEAETASNRMQIALDGIDVNVNDLSSQLLLASQSGSATSLDQASEKAVQVFKSVVGYLNSTAAGRGLFSGAASNHAALADADAILSQLRTDLAGETTLSGIDQRLDAWFDTPGGGFDTMAYTGGQSPGAPFRLSEDTHVAVALRADHQVFRDILKSTAKAAVTNDATLGVSSDLKVNLLKSAGENLLSSKIDLVDLQAGIGLSQELIDQSLARNEAAATALNIARNGILGVDQYEAATGLEAAQSQIESLYAATVRSSRLSLLEFMR